VGILGDHAAKVGDIVEAASLCSQSCLQWSCACQEVGEGVPSGEAAERACVIGGRRGAASFQAVEDERIVIDSIAAAEHETSVRGCPGEAEARRQQGGMRVDQRILRVEDAERPAAELTDLPRPCDVKH